MPDPADHVPGVHPCPPLSLPLRCGCRSVSHSGLCDPRGVSCVKELAGFDLDRAGLSTCTFRLRLLGFSPYGVPATLQVTVVPLDQARRRAFGWFLSGRSSCCCYRCRSLNLAGSRMSRSGGPPTMSTVMARQIAASGGRRCGWRPRSPSPAGSCGVRRRATTSSRICPGRRGWGRFLHRCQRPGVRGLLRCHQRRPRGEADQDSPEHQPVGHPWPVAAKRVDCRNSGVAAHRPMPTWPMGLRSEATHGRDLISRRVTG